MLDGLSGAHCCRSLTYETDCGKLPLPHVAALVELTHLHLCYHEEEPVLDRLSSLTNLKDLSLLNTAGFYQEVPVPSNAEVTKLAVMGLLVSFA